MIFFDRTSAVVDKTIKDLALLSYWITIVVQVIFLLLYGFKIFLNVNRLFYLVIYCFLSAVSLFGFIFYCVTYKKKKQKQIVGTKQWLRISRYIANITMIIVIIIEYTELGATDLEIILSGVSIISLMIQLLFELLRLAYDKYSELLITAVNMDFEKFIKPFDIKGNFYYAVDAPLELISNKITGVKKMKSEPTEVEKYVDQLTTDYKKQRKIEKNKRANNEKLQIIEHFKVLLTIFRKSNQKKPNHLPTTKNISPKQIAKK